MEMKYMSVVSDEITIKQDKLPFKITTNKCKSYLDIHYPELETTDDILIKCKNILIYLLRYMNDYYDDEEDLIFISQNEFWNGILDRFWCPIRKFKLLFYNEKIHLLCDNPGKNSLKSLKESGLKIYSIVDLLINDDDYKIFLDYWSTQYDYYDIFDSVKCVTDKHNVPEELIDMIICLTI